jgi:hypothetical protein
VFHSFHEPRNLLRFRWMRPVNIRLHTTFKDFATSLPWRAESREPPQKLAHWRTVRRWRNRFYDSIWTSGPCVYDLWIFLIYHDISDIWWYLMLYLYIGDDSLYGFWMDLNPNSVACRPWSQTLPVELRTSPWRWLWSMNQPHFLPCLMSLMLHSALHPQAQKFKNGAAHREVNFHMNGTHWPGKLRASGMTSYLIYPSKKTSNSSCRRPLQFQVLVGLFRLVTSGGFLGTWRPSVMAELWLKVYPTGQDHAMKCGFQVVTPRIWDNTCKNETEWDWLGKIHHV